MFSGGKGLWLFIISLPTMNGPRIRRGQHGKMCEAGITTLRLQINRQPSNYADPRIITVPGRWCNHKHAKSA